MNAERAGQALRAVPDAAAPNADEQQPVWEQHPAFGRVREALATAGPLVRFDDVIALRHRLAAVALGQELMLQAGDCAESLYECTAWQTESKLAALDHLADYLSARTGRPVIRVGRIGGQYAKPRSSPHERHGNRTIASFRGHMVNSEVPTAAARQHDPRRMQWVYEASKKVLDWTAAYREPESKAATDPARGPWASHEILVMDYESSLVRTDPGTGQRYLSSTHLPWIGARTNDPDGAQVQALTAVRNPVGCKIGPGSDIAHVLRICALLDPGREPGRLVLIARFGRDLIASALPPLVRAVRDAGHPVIWLTDPMHGNTVRSASGLKTRRLDDISHEACTFRRVLEDAGVHPAGLHLEVAASDVTECLGGAISSEADLPLAYTTLCDPRLNVDQARPLLDQWAGLSLLRGKGRQCTWTGLGERSPWLPARPGGSGRRWSAPLPTRER